MAAHHHPRLHELASPVLTELDPLWSSGDTWSGVSAALYRLQTSPDAYSQNHSLLLHLRPSMVELTLLDRLSRNPAPNPRKLRRTESQDLLLVSLSPEVLTPAAAGFIERLQPDWTPHVYLRDDQLELLCLALKAEAETGYISGPLYGEFLSLALGARLSTQISGEQGASFQKGGLAPHIMRRVNDHIEQNLESSLTITSIAEVAGLSQYRFAHNFKAMVGVPPHQYIMRRRVERAKQLLRDTDQPMLEIALSSGCQSSSRFNSLFKKIAGTTPTAYRARFR